MPSHSAHGANIQMVVRAYRKRRNMLWLGLILCVLYFASAELFLHTLQQESQARAADRWSIDWAAEQDNRREDRSVTPVVTGVLPTALLVTKWVFVGSYFVIVFAAIAVGVIEEQLARRLLERRSVGAYLRHRKNGWRGW